MAKFKSVEYRVKELNRALKALMNANNNFDTTHDDSYLLTTEAQLRGLVCRTRKNKPLLLELAKELKLPLDFYSAPPPSNPPPPDLAIHITMGKSWSVKPRRLLIKYTLDEWLSTPAFFTDSSREYQPRNAILERIANKDGGTHYDEKIDPIVDYMQRQTLSIGDKHFDGIQLFLLDISALVYWQGSRLIHLLRCRETGIYSFQDKELIILDNHFDKVTIGNPETYEILAYGEVQKTE